ncbi:ABC-2 type transport system ATP-binding protein [Pedococcus dokdonensis]|uniref:ABC-2 type transport system ATP-binding protein n=1 Tax=Pedococcus dokdonensis TaxID=443156 RepID=A0A1H0RPS3_9MICO|nr:ABC transporter ATP-binding protein [Pedococcus dokdonensis]SDP30968.1 ABC-2 type transport system ATP-binding protein [Pedococcus dokdonensis]
MAPVIEAVGLTKTFGSTTALDGLDLTVHEGEVHGFLGPNGAGKSTTIRVLLGLLRADAGTVRLLDRDPWADATELHRRLAYVPGDVVLWPNLTGGEVIDLLGRLRGGVSEGRRAELLEAFELDPTKKGRSYSKGNRQKVALVAAFASDVPLLVLDEPTSGLDPLMEKVFQEHLARVRDEGRTVLLSSHILSEVETAADRVSIVRAGRVVDSGSLADLRHLTRTSITATLARPVSDTEAGRWPGVESARQDRERLVLSVGTSSVGDVLQRLGGHGIQALTCQPPTLEELFLSQYRDDLGTAAGNGAGAGAKEEVSA